MQGWGHRTYRPSRKHALETKVNAVSAACKEHQRCALGEYRISLEKDIAKLQKKLRQEVDTHRALERAFRRTLGVLPRFSPLLPPKIRELLAEVAVLEEEVINLEEHVVCLRQGLYTEAACLLTSKQQKECSSNSEPLTAKEKTSSRSSLQAHHLQNGVKGRRNSVIAKLLPPVMENKRDGSYITAAKPGNIELQKSAHSNFVNEKTNPQMSIGYTIHYDVKPSLNGEIATPRVKTTCQNEGMEEQDLCLENDYQQKTSRKFGKLWPQPTDAILCETARKFSTTAPKTVDSYVDIEGNLEPNALSEEMVMCLSSVFVKLTRPAMISDCETSSTVSHSTLSSIWSFGSRHSVNYKHSMDLPDLYGTCIEPRDIGPYKYCHDITANSLDYSRIPRSTSLLKRLTVLVDKLSIVDLQGLTHQQKLAFWINIYNVCMMHAFLEHGIPTSPHKVVALMGKAIVNVGGHFLSALAIEHFILRLPSDLKNTDGKSREKDAEKIMCSTYGLEWPEPSVSFALCCGSWSSPAVRVYTPLKIENELEAARNEYLQAAVGVTPTKVIIPKILDWYMRDFAKDAESLIEWITEQLPSSLSKAIHRCLANRQGQALSEVVEVMPYNFNFRYLLALQPM